jgi:uncharacterized membrane protein
MPKFLRWLRDSFLSGLVAILPLGLTLYVLWLLYRLAYNLFGPDTTFAQLLTRAFGRYIPGVEVAITLLVVLAVGAIVRHWLGRRILWTLEQAVLALPGVRKLYWAARQLIHVLLLMRRDEGLGSQRRLVLVEFPYPGSYVVGMVTSEDLTQVSPALDRDAVSVYVPTAPNPLSGWLLFIPRAKLVPLDLTMEEWVSLVLSGGLVTPSPGKAKESADADQKG